MAGSRSAGDAVDRARRGGPAGLALRPGPGRPAVDSLGFSGLSLRVHGPELEGVISPDGCRLRGRPCIMGRRSPVARAAARTTVDGTANGHHTPRRRLGGRGSPGRHGAGRREPSRDRAAPALQGPGPSPARGLPHLPRPRRRAARASRPPATSPPATAWSCDTDAPGGRRACGRPCSTSRSRC